MRKTISIFAVLTILFVAVASIPAMAQDDGNPSQVQNQRQVKQQKQHKIKDGDGNGVCDVCGEAVGSGRNNADGKQAKKGKHWGPGDRSGNQGQRPQDGTGYGSRSGKKLGPQDGTGQAGSPNG